MPVEPRPHPTMAWRISRCSTARRTPPVGTGTDSLWGPLNTNSHDGRAQMIYLASELGGPARITALAIQVILTDQREPLHQFYVATPSPRPRPDSAI
jgi:hypothetical protein